ncbi:hypothetical protein KFK09_004849 [Dendrobium nobile]|uniref:Uncharacterized protein n=1 Tax=Dendrobium nobile TaxID=94219 RepID=A0A8T3BU36_DENNO|nr:hypothetical protein KFK09_004849 [Dendrobium nobile]
MLNCWHWCNLNYDPPSNRRVLIVQQNNPSTVEWVLDLGAYLHLTSDATNLQHSTPYNGLDSILITNESMLPIQNTGQGILPLIDSLRKIHLPNLLQVPSLSHC